MINNHYTLVALVAEIEADLKTSLITACLTRSENALVLILAGPRQDQMSLVVSCKPRLNYLLLDKHPGKKLRGANVLPEAVGKAIDSVSVRENDRTVMLGLSGGSRLIINLFGTHSNVYLEDTEKGLIGSFLKRKANEPHIGSGPKNGLHLPEDAADFANRFRQLTGSPEKKLSTIFPVFGREIVKEVLYRLGGEVITLSSEESGSHPEERQLARLYDTADEVRKELDSPHPRIYYEDGLPVLMSLLEMKHLGYCEVTAYDSVNTCIANFVSEAARHSTAVELKDSLVSGLLKKREDLAATIRKIEKDISVNREEKYRMYGTVLLEHLGEIKKGQSSFKTGHGDASLLIPLDEKLTPVENSQAYFGKSKKARESHRQAIARKEELAKLLHKVEGDLEAAVRETDIKALGSLEKKEKAKSEPQTPFRHFQTGEYNIYVGKDAANNDELTFGFAKPNDVFLHARGVSGSHVIIRNKSRDYPQKVVIEYAASIAAYYSKARPSKLVPVAYTMRKYVKKARGKPGAVFLDREEVVFVVPKIPQDSR
ncbi:MAG: NFACT RNA binding domain-containing protein [Bacteroidetes bacterium]|nr:NFACT RNA binding domain-containing protein [Bacteroidota bacterium]